MARRLMTVSRVRRWRGHGSLVQARGQRLGLPCRQPGVHLRAGQVPPGREQQQAQGAPLSGRQPFSPRPLQTGPPFVVRQYHQMPTRSHGTLRLRPDPVQVTGVIATAFPHPAGVEPATGSGSGGLAVIKQGKGRHQAGDCKTGFE